MNPDMGIDTKVLKMEQQWEDSRLDELLKKYNNRDNLCHKIIQLEDKNFDLNSEVRVLKTETQYLTKTIVSLENKNLTLSSQVKVMNKRSIKNKIQNFINRIFKRLGYIRSTG